eukprot:s1286_g10.t1
MDSMIIHDSYPVERREIFSVWGLLARILSSGGFLCLRVTVLVQNNGKPMGVAVVALNSKEDADYVLEVLNGQYMKNRYIEVFHHVEGEAGTDKAFVQVSNGSTTGATGGDGDAEGCCAV